RSEPHTAEPLHGPHHKVPAGPEQALQASRATGTRPGRSELRTAEPPAGVRRGRSGPRAAAPQGAPPRTAEPPGG
ncbi:hypothetical protein ACIGFK_18390, partial [Streptomyces sp. NPDC085524]